MTEVSAAVAGTCAAIARRADPDRFLVSLFAPAACREALFVLIAFNHELVRAVAMPSARSGAGPIATLIRLQWWREVVEGVRTDWRNHEVAAPLRAMLDRAAGPAVSVATLLRLIAAREAGAEGFEDLAAWRQGMLDGDGGVQRGVAELLGLDVADQERAALVGAAYGTAMLHRHLDPGRLHRTGLPEQVATADGAAEALDRILLQEGSAFVSAAGRGRRNRAGSAAFLPLVLARRDLRRPPLGVPTGRGVADRLAVLRAALAGGS